MKNKLIPIFFWIATGIIFILPLFIIIDIVLKGLPKLTWSLLTENPTGGGKDGGIKSIIVSTFLIISLTAFFTFSFGMLASIYLYIRKKSKLKTALILCIDILAGVPSIVYGLFGFAFFGIALHLGFAILSGALTLTIMVLPLFIQTTTNTFLACPKDYTDAATALGMSTESFIFKILLPISLPGISTAFILSVGRSLSETAALLFTAGYALRMPSSIFDSGRSLSVHILDLTMNIPGGESLAMSSAIILMVMAICLNLIAKRIPKWYFAAKEKIYG